MMTRRSVVGAIAAGAISGLRTDGSLAAPRKPLFGFKQYGMKRIPVRQAIAHIAGIGYKALELTLLPGWDTEPKRLTRSDRVDIRNQIHDAGLELSAVMESLRLGSGAGSEVYLERLRTAAEMAHELSPGAPAMIETAVGGQPTLWEQTKAEMADQLSAWARALEPLKTVLAIKGHVGNALDRPEKMLWMFDRVQSPWIRMGYDYSHYRIHGLDMRKTMQQLVGRSVFIHVKDSIGGERDYRFLLPGDSGEIDYAKYARILQEIGYQGPVLAEVSSQLFEKAGYDGVAAAKRCWENLAPFFA